MQTCQPQYYPAGLAGPNKCDGYDGIDWHPDATNTSAQRSP